MNEEAISLSLSASYQLRRGCNGVVYFEDRQSMAYGSLISIEVLIDSLQGQADTLKLYAALGKKKWLGEGRGVLFHISPDEFIRARINTYLMQ